MLAPGDSPQQPALAAIDGNRDGTSRGPRRTNRSQGLRHLTQTGYRVDPGHDHSRRIRDDVLCPAEPSHRQVDQNAIVALSDHVEKGIESGDIDVADIE